MSLNTKGRTRPDEWREHRLAKKEKKTRRGGRREGSRELGLEGITKIRRRELSVRVEMGERRYTKTGKPLVAIPSSASLLISRQDVDGCRGGSGKRLAGPKVIDTENNNKDRLIQCNGLDA
ncbi:hypothetical protein C8J57DRAFT_1212911 [Mycena rebaudengoi]|nr:hypothetical protein C8J57DRAFT_1212911 [Mycena rebaudengoi]